MAELTRFTAWLRGYLGAASTAVVAWVVAWAAEHGLPVDFADELQVVLIGIAGIVVLVVERALVDLARRVERWRWFEAVVTVIRFGQPLPSYDTEAR